MKANSSKRKMDMLRKFLILVACLAVCRYAIATPDADTVSLLHCEGTHDSQIFTDTTGLHTYSVYGGSPTPKLSTVNFKYGTGSMSIAGGANRFIYSTTSLTDYDFASGDRTVEAWIYINSAANQDLFGFPTNGYARFTNDGKLEVLGTSTTLSTNTGVFSTGEWFHLALVKYNTTTYVYKNGSLVASGTQPVHCKGSNSQYNIGETQGTSFNGYIDEFRVSDVARYTTTFTPPSNGYMNALDIRFYYTGTGTAAWPNSSLGGTTTTNEIPGMTHNVFDWVSESEAGLGDTEYRAIDIKNDSITDNLQSVVVWLANQGSYSTVSYGYDGTATQSVATESTAPSGITFSSGTTKATGVSLGNMNAGTKKRVWLRRVIPVGATHNTDNPSLRVEGAAP